MVGLIITHNKYLLDRFIGGHYANKIVKDIDADLKKTKRDCTS